MPNLHLQKDSTTPFSTEAVDWVTKKLDWTSTVRAWVPEGYESYARILHPAYKRLRGQGTSVSQVGVPWRTVSEWSGKPLQATSHIEDLMLRPDGLTWSEQNDYGWQPRQGELDEPTLSSLLVHLAIDISDLNEIWMLTWTGFGGQSDIVGLPVRVTWFLAITGREYVLRKGSITSSTDNLEDPRFANPPTFWWPDDRSWFASSDIDSSSTYIGGSRELIERILNDPALEALPADLNGPYDGLYVSRTPMIPIKRRVSRTELFRESLYRFLFRIRIRLRRKRSSGAILFQKKRFWEWRIRP